MKVNTGYHSPYEDIKIKKIERLCKGDCYHCRQQKKCLKYQKLKF